MVESEKPEPPSYDVAVECLEELESMLTTTAIKIEDTPAGKALVLFRIKLAGRYASNTKYPLRRLL